MHNSALILGLTMAVAFSGAHAGGAEEPVLGGPCEGCELVFVGMPEAVSSRARIAPEGEPGDPLRIEGVVYDSLGHPVPNVIVYAYHTDSTGVYPSFDTRHGRLRGWARTDAEGRYCFDTIRPASYPHGSIPQHVHMHVIEPNRGTYWIASITFDDDPLMTARDRADAKDGRGGSGLVDPVRGEDGNWLVRRDIILGLKIPGYPLGQ